jgi:hypothetical protein
MKPIQLYFQEFVEALVRSAFLQRKESLENGTRDMGGLHPQNIAKDLEAIIKQLKGALPRK